MEIDVEQNVSNWKPSVPGMAYVGISYTGKLGEDCPMELREQSFKTANSVSAYFMSKEEIIFSPISHSHPIHFSMGSVGNDHSFWMRYNKEMARYCNRLYVICTPGWKESKGLMMEMDWFRKDKKPIFLIALLGGGKMGIVHRRPTGQIVHPYSVDDRKMIVESFK